ncbi:MAG: hypothetical protein KKD44_13315 [Proteobacteria bacterium]|nr:hypothetical protein [Pseudomonadota bacterium]
MQTLKNYELYPEDHSVTVNAITDCMENIDAFFETQPSLTLGITKDHFLHDGMVVFQGGPGDENPAFQMYRDGIERLDLLRGLSRDEFVSFLGILKDHATAKKHEETDIVTELWEADFRHITYEATDIFWKDESIMDFSHVRVMDQNHREQPLSDTQSFKSMGEYNKRPDINVYLLSTEEIKNTMDMVRGEEQRNFDMDLFDVLLIILNEQNEEKDFVRVLDIITECFKNTLERAEFSSVIRFLKKIDELHGSYQTNQPWAIPHLEDFVLILSGKDVLGSLHKAWPVMDVNDESQLEDMKQALNELSPQAIYTLCPMVYEIPTARIQNQLIEVIKTLSNKDYHPLIKLLSHPDEKVVQNVIFILGQFDGAEQTKALINKLKTTTGPLRLELVKCLSKRQPVLVDTFAPLLDDPDLSVKHCVIERLGKEKNARSEKLLMNMLCQKKFKKEELSFLLKIYRALGGCGSRSALPFLEKQLLKKNWFGNKVLAIHREGAILALNSIKIPEADQMVSKYSNRIKDTQPRWHGSK